MEEKDFGSFHTKYTMGEVLGEGAYGVVRKATSHDSDFQGNANVEEENNEQKVAVKCITKKRLNQKAIESLHQEVEILKSLDHPNIIKYVNYFENDDDIHIVMEVVDGGDLYDRVKQRSYSEDEARGLICNLLSAIKYFHDRDVIHRDLRPENILLKSMNDDIDIKVADFGFAVKIPNESRRKTVCGAPSYIAPEILEKQPYGKSVDMWSVGVISFILLVGYPPFLDNNQIRLSEKIKNAEFIFDVDDWEDISLEAIDFIKELLIVNVTTRMTVEVAICHPWIQRQQYDFHK